MNLNFGFIIDFIEKYLLADRDVTFDSEPMNAEYGVIQQSLSNKVQILTSDILYFIKGNVNNVTYRRNVILRFVMFTTYVHRTVTESRSALVSLSAVVGCPCIKKHAAPAATSGDVIISTCAAGAVRRRSSTRQQVQSFHQQSTTYCRC